MRLESQRVGGSRQPAFLRRSVRGGARLWFVAWLSLFVAGCSSCRSDETAAGADARSPAAELTPVPEPAGLLAELYVQDPASSWKRLRELAGGTVALLPSTFPVLTATLLGLPVDAAGLVDGEVPLLGALVDVAGRPPLWVIGLHVKSGRELVKKLTTGSDSAFTARDDAALGIAHLEPKSKNSAPDAALGVIGNYLLVAERAEHLTQAGPFVARTLPTRPVPAEQIVVVVRRAALAGPIAQKLKSAWRGYAEELAGTDRKNRERHGGRAPDFGDPAAALGGVQAAVDAISALLESAEDLRLVVEPLEERLELRLELRAQAQGATAELLKELRMGGLEPLLELPKGTMLGVVTRSSAAERLESAEGAAERLNALFLDRMTPADQKLVTDTLSALARARGDSTSYGLVAREDSAAMVIKGALSDAEALDEGVKGLFRLIRIKAFAEPVRQFIGAVTIKESSVTVPGLEGKVSRALLRVSPSALSSMLMQGSGEAGPTPKPIDIVWYGRDGSLYAALAREAPPLLVELVSAPQASRLAGNAQLVAAAGRAGQASFAVFVEPLELGMGGGAHVGSAPVLLTFGGSGRTALLRVEAARAAVQALARAAASP